MIWHLDKGLAGETLYVLRPGERPIGILTRIGDHRWALMFANGATVLRGTLEQVKKIASKELGIKT